jgi:hypothetical protein
MVKEGVKRGNYPVLNQSKGQVTIFIIIGILIVVGVVAYFLLRGSFGAVNIPPAFEPAYTAFLTCIEEDTSVGISLLESQAGYIELPAFDSGSSHMPFSNQLSFLGNPVPYWYYVSGNNIAKEQVPSRTDMERQLSEFLDTRVRGCDLREYYGQGFEITFSESEAKASIRENRVDVDMNMDLTMILNEETVLVRNHDVSVNSQLGALYDTAKKVYDKEQSEMFLEEYAVDTLRLYAPVDGVEITCSPLTWNAPEVFSEIQDGIEANTLALNVKNDDYFDIGLSTGNQEVRFLNSRDWAHGFEVNPSEGPLLLATPAGNQPGMGIIGFCYVPYHFVYDVKYPVMVQVFEGDEIFQFPMAVVVEDNNPRESLADAEAAENVVPELCAYKNTAYNVNVRDRNGNPIQADISYECFSNKCSIGQTSESGALSEDFPQCVNGYVHANAEGYRDARYIASTVAPGSVDIIMEKLYLQRIQLKLDGQNYNGNAIVYFTSGDYNAALDYPNRRVVELSEGSYEIQVHIYRESSITIGATVTEQCITVPRGGILGVIGLQQERCFDIEIPEQVISNALSGGGEQSLYIFENDLAAGRILEINSGGLPIPQSAQELSDNYVLFENNGLDFNFI